MQRKVATAAQAKTVTTEDVTGDTMGKIVEPSIINTWTVRALALAAAVLATIVSSTVMPGSAAVAANVLCSGVWLGMNFWVTLIAGFVMIKNMPRQTFGRLQAKLFPINFGITTLCATVVLATLFYGPLAGVATTRTQLVVAAGLATALLNLLFLEPISTKILFERYDLENSTEIVISQDKRKELTKKFGMFHGMSSLAALVNLIAAVAHTVWLGLLLRTVF